MIRLAKHRRGAILSKVSLKIGTKLTTICNKSSSTEKKGIGLKLKSFFISIFFGKLGQATEMLFFSRSYGFLTLKTWKNTGF